MIEYYANKGNQICDLLLRKWLLLREIVYILRIPLRATIELQREDLTLSDVYGIWTKMRLHLEKCVNKTCYQTSLASYLLDALIIRQDSIFSNPFMIAAIFLDPRFRNQITSDEIKVVEAKNLLCDLWRRISHRIAQTQQENQNNSPEICFDFDANVELDNYLSGKRTTAVNDSENDPHFDIELAIELFQPSRLPPNNSILEYWKTAKD